MKTLFSLLAGAAVIISVNSATAADMSGPMQLTKLQMDKIIAGLTIETCNGCVAADKIDKLDFKPTFNFPPKKKDKK